MKKVHDCPNCRCGELCEGLHCLHVGYGGSFCCHCPYMDHSKDYQSWGSDDTVSGPPGCELQILVS